MPSSFPGPDVDAFAPWARATSSATRAALFLCFVALLLGAVMARVDAATLTVINTNDSGPGSLRQGIADAQDGDTIQFDAALNGHTIALTSGELVINTNVGINGPGPEQLTVSRSQAGPEFGIVHVIPGHIVTVQGLTISGGLVLKFGHGFGGIFNEQSTVNIENCTNASNGPFFSGGGFL